MRSQAGAFPRSPPSARTWCSGCARPISACTARPSRCRGSASSARRARAFVRCRRGRWSSASAVCAGGSHWMPWSTSTPSATAFRTSSSVRTSRSTSPSRSNGPHLIATHARRWEPHTHVIEATHFHGLWRQPPRELEAPTTPAGAARPVRELASSRFIASAENAPFFGPPGVGKTHLAIALGRAVVEAGHTVLFTTATALLADLVDGQSKGILASRMFFYGKPKLLVVDELGYMPLERQSAHLFFQLVSHRYEKASMLITTNQSVTQWGQVFGDDVIAAAILDRLLHHSHTFVTTGTQAKIG